MGEEERGGWGMKRLELKPDGFPQIYTECPPGLFLFKDNVCFKSEYFTTQGDAESYCDSGEYFWGGVSTIEERNNLIVQPLKYEWIDL